MCKIKIENRHDIISSNAHFDTLESTKKKNRDRDPNWNLTPSDFKV